jgi:hypothetical protein
LRIEDRRSNSDIRCDSRSSIFNRVSVKFLHMTWVRIASSVRSRQETHLLEAVRHKSVLIASSTSLGNTPATRSYRDFASQCSTVHDYTLEAMRTQLHSHRAAKTPRAYSSILNIAKADECNYIASHHETWRYYQPAHLGRIVVSSLPMAKLTTCTRKR